MYSAAVSGGNTASVCGGKGCLFWPEPSFDVVVLREGWWWMMEGVGVRYLLWGVTYLYILFEHTET